MHTLAVIWGILSFVLMIIGIFPCLGALNWINIPFSIVGLVVSLIALARKQEEKKAGSIIGVVFCGIAILVGLIRLVFGMGVV